MTSIPLVKMTVRYCCQNNIRMMVVGFALAIGIILGGLFMIFCLSPARQGDWGRDLIPYTLVIILLSPVLFKSDFSKKLVGFGSFVGRSVMGVVIVTATIVLLCFAEPYLSCIPLGFARGFFKVFFGFPTIFFAIISSLGIYGLWSKQNTSALVLDHSGMWVDRFGLIPWSNIAAIGASAESAPPCLFVKVKDPEALRAQATRMGKLFLMVANKFGKLVYSPGYHISATGLDTPNDAIIAFASKYMQSDVKN